ncbi:hypothetical protein [Psychrobacillus sp. NPDC096389]|uniref:hypothetical protein n=1 Tax=Psychrobacillus sp. NPDC096389 TaxID=3364490 RepID=UPI00381DB45C
MKIYMKIFMYFFLMSVIFGMSSIYLRENFQQPFNTLDILDISRIVLTGIIEIASGLLIIDTYIRLNKYPKLKNFIISNSYSKLSGCFIGSHKCLSLS